MPFEQNKSGNPKGRPKGTLNKSTVGLRGWMTAFIEANREQVQKDWMKLDPKDRVQLFEKFLKYSLPTLQSTSMDLKFENMTEEQLDLIINQLRESIVNNGSSE